MRIPYATRRLVNEYLVIAKVVANDDYLEMTEQAFVGHCLKLSGGNMNPNRVRQIYLELMKDAGLPPLFSTPFKLEDNGDHSWEYYVDGKTVSEEEYAKNAHTSYFTA